jgi:hypothetical protein
MLLGGSNSRTPRAQFTMFTVRHDVSGAYLSSMGHRYS